LLLVLRHCESGPVALRPNVPKANGIYYAFVNIPMDSCRELGLSKPLKSDPAAARPSVPGPQGGLPPRPLRRCVRRELL